ncbi:DUF6090 family protein [Winogradskyella poriferorum]|uniref:DUF6090 family protein n=1 Tax=Winogradskyella poriferorum TaxID=307627 RepID=UPI003D659164
MIKFFRHIRKSLLRQNELGKYTKYAIGEIVLLVIGILIALQINNWNAERKDRAREAVLLNQIHKDFTNSKLQLDSIIAFNTQKTEKLSNLVALMTKSRDSNLIATMMQYGDDIAAIRTFNPANGTVEAIINSSSFELITNDSLRGLLVAWKDVYTDYSEEEQFALNFQTDHFFPFFRTHFDYLNPYNEDMLNIVKTVEFQNIWLDNLRHTRNILDAVKGEHVEEYINEILRHTAHYD